MRSGEVVLNAFRADLRSVAVSYPVRVQVAHAMRGVGGDVLVDDSGRVSNACEFAVWGVLDGRHGGWLEHGQIRGE